MPLIAGMTLRTLPRLLAAAWLGLACYCLLSLAFGKGGFLASSSSGAELAAMQDNLESLSDLNRNLSVEIAALQNDPDRAKREALPLGWLAKGEYEIVLTDRPLPSKPQLSPGKVLPASAPTGLGDLDIKATSLIVVLLAFGLSWLRDFRASGRGTTRAKQRRPASKSKTKKTPKRPERPSTAAADTSMADTLA